MCNFNLEQNQISVYNLTEIYQTRIGMKSYDELKTEMEGLDVQMADTKKPKRTEVLKRV